MVSNTILLFSPRKFGNDPIWRSYYSDGWLNHQLEKRGSQESGTRMQNTFTYSFRIFFFESKVFVVSSILLKNSISTELCPKKVFNKNNDNHDIYDNNNIDSFDDNNSIDSFDDNNNVYTYACMLFIAYVYTHNWIYSDNLGTHNWYIPSHETTISPKNGWLEYKPLLLGFGLFSGANLLLVSGRVSCPKKKPSKFPMDGVYWGYNPLTNHLHPPKQTWNLKMDPWKRRFLLETIISRFHVNFWGCIIFLGHPSIPSFIIPPWPQLNVPDPLEATQPFPASREALFGQARPLGGRRTRGSPGWVSVEVLLFWDLRWFGNFIVKWYTHFLGRNQESNYIIQMYGIFERFPLFLCNCWVFFWE